MLHGIVLGEQETPPAASPGKISVAACSDPQDRTRERCYRHFLSLPSEDWSLKSMLPSKKGIAAAYGFSPDHPRRRSVLLPFQGFAELHYRVEDRICSPVICWFNQRHGWNRLPDSKSVRFLLLAESETSHCSPLLPLKTVPGIDVNWLQSIWPTQ